MTKKTQWYIDRAKEIHSGFYSYELVDHIQRNSDRIKIICPVHGVFEQIVSGHINARNGCSKCSGCKKRTREDLMEQFKSVHGDKFIYGDFEYTGNKQKIPIICREHGEFHQGVKEHYMGSGCPKCAKNGKLNRETFLIKLEEKLGADKVAKLDYSDFEYIGYDIITTVSCPKHGPYETTPHKLMCGYGCKRCVSNSSNSENEWLDGLNISDLRKQCTIRVNGKALIVDGYSPSKKTVYEFHGDFFHGNPQYFHPDDENPVSKKTFGELYTKTKQKQSMIENAGYKYQYIWESEFKKSKGKNSDPKYKDLRKEWLEHIQKRIEYEKLWIQADGVEDYDWGRMKNALKS